MTDTNFTQSTDSIIKGSEIDLSHVKSNTRIKKDFKNSPFRRRNLEHPTSENDTLIHLLKGSLGTGILAMPYAFSNIGIVLGVPATYFIGFICAYCVHMMINSSHELCWRHNLTSLDFGTLAEYAFKYGPKQIRKGSKVARYVIQVFIVLVATGACCVYLVFVADSIKKLVEDTTGNDTIIIEYYILMVTALELCLVMIRDLKYLTPVSLLSNCLILASLIIIYTFFFDGLPAVNSVPDYVEIGRLPVFFSTAVFALEGITVVLPLENSMKIPEHFNGCFRVLNTAMTVIVSLYAFTGFFGFLRYYAEGIEGSISLNLPEDDPLSYAVQAMLAVAIASTYPLQFYCSMQFTWPGLSGLFKKFLPKMTYLSSLPGEIGYRIILVLITMTIALLLPNLESLMSLIGAVCLSTVGIMFPALLETIVYWDDLGPKKYILWKNLLIFIFGATGFATGLYTSIKDIIALNEEE